MSPLREKLIEELTLRGFSPRTHERYVASIEALSLYYRRSPDGLSDGEIRAFLMEEHKRGLSPSSLNVMVSAMRFFYSRILKRDMEELRELVPRVRNTKNRPKVYSREEIGRLIRDGCHNVFERAFLMTVYGSGLRLNEACHLKIMHIESSRMMVRVEQGKGRKDRYTILSPWALTELRAYYRQERPKDWLFPSRRDRSLPMIDGTAQKVFYTALERAGLPNRGGIHCLRHSFATHLVEAGVDLPCLKMLLGHAHFSTTAGYVYVSERRLATITSPLDALQEAEPKTC